DAAIYFLYRIPDIETKLFETKLLKTRSLANAFMKIKGDKIIGLSQDVCQIDWKIGTQDDANTIIGKYLTALLGIIPELEIRSLNIKQTDKIIEKCQIENFITINLIDPKTSSAFFPSIKESIDQYHSGIRTDITEIQKYYLSNNFLIVGIDRGIKINNTFRKINSSISIAADDGILKLTSTPINVECKQNYDGKPDVLVDFTPIAVVLHSSNSNDTFTSSESG